MSTRKFEVDPLTVSLYVTQIKRICEELYDNYWNHYQSIHKVVWDSVVHVCQYRKGADIDILSDLLYTLCRVQSVYIEAIKSGEFYTISDWDIIIIEESDIEE